MRFASLFVVALIVGCTPPSLNVQRASLRASGDVAATVYLDNVDTAAVDAKRAELEGILRSVDAFLSSGNVADLPLAEVAEQLNRIVPAEYRQYVSTAVSAADTQNVDVTKAIGADNAAWIRAFLKGALIGAADYDTAHRSQTAPETGSGAAEGGGP